MSHTVIEAADLAHKAIEFFNCPSRMYLLSEVASELSKRASCTITEADVKEFRELYLTDNIDLPVPLIDNTVQMSTPTTIEEMCNNAMIDTMGLRNGVAAQSFKVFTEADKNGDGKLSLNALDLMLKSADSLDKKWKQIAPNADPAAIILKSKEFQKFKNILIILDQKYPECELLARFEEEMKLQIIMDGTFTDQ